MRIVMEKLFKFSLFIGFLIAGSSLFAQEPPAEFDFVRPLGMGGAFTAVADDHNIFNYNPAGMVQRTGTEFTVLEIAVGASQDTKEAIDFVSDNENDLTNFENLTAQRQAELLNEITDNISRLDPRIYAAGDVASFVSGPSFFGLPFHVGAGAFGTVDSSFRLDTGVLIPVISYEINNDIIVPVAVAKRFQAPWIIPGQIGVGLTGKFLSRRQVKRERQSVLELDDLESPPLASGHGIGSDLGVLHQVTDRVNWGLMVRDFLGTKLSYDAVDAEKGFQSLPARDTVIRPRTNVGVALVPKSFFWMLPTGDRWVFAADVRDVLNKDEHLFFENGFRKPFGENLYTHVHLGTEFRYWFVRLRGGVNQGYPTLGLGIDIPFFKLNYAYYGRELGAKAGDIRQNNHIISLALKFGTGHVEARERIESN